jgi:hypothetical protein
VVAIGYQAGKSNTVANQFILQQTNINPIPLIQGDFSTGYLGINKINPTYSLDVSGTTQTDKLMITSPSSGNTGDKVLVWNSVDKKVKQITSSDLGEDNNTYNKTIIITSTTLTNDSLYVILVNHTVPITITLPLTPFDGQALKIKDVSVTGALTNNITIDRNGNSIDRVTDNALINTDGGALELIYDASLTSWFALGFIN